MAKLQTVYLIIEEHNQNVYMVCADSFAADHFAEVREEKTGNKCEVTPMPVSHATLDQIYKI